MAAKLDLFPSGFVSKATHERKPSPGNFIMNLHKIKNFLNKQSTKLFAGFLGIFVSYLIFGIVQESM